MCIVIETVAIRSFLESDRYYKNVAKFYNYCEKNSNLKKLIKLILPNFEVSLKTPISILKR